jgi:O-antigen/teichoic acid export membrane protein
VAEPRTPPADGAAREGDGDAAREGGGGGAAREAGERAARNTVVRAGGEILGKVASLALLAILAREVGDARFGVFVFALAWGEIAMTPVGLGIDQYLLRAIAADRGRLDELFANAVYLKLWRGIPIVAASVVLVNVLDLSSETRQAVAILTVGLFLDTLARTFMNVFNAFERGELVAATIVAQRLVAAAAGIALLLAGYGVVEVAAAWSVGAAVRVGMSAWLLVRRVGRPRATLPPAPRLELRRRSLPFTTQDLFGLVLARADVMILAALATDAVVGRYGSAYRLLDSTTFIVVALTGAFTAMYTYLGPDTTPTLASVFQRSQKLCLALLVPIAVALGLLAEPICRLFFGAEFEAAADPLRLLAPVVVLFGVMVLSSVLVLSREHPRRMIVTVAVAAAVNIGLNFALVPPLDDVGAALAMLASMVVYAAIAFRLALLDVGRVDWVSMLAAPTAAGAAMAVPLLLLGGAWPVAAAVGVAVYLAVYAAVDRVVDPGDLRFVVDLARRRAPGRRAAA